MNSEFKRTASFGLSITPILKNIFFFSPTGNIEKTHNISEERFRIQIDQLLKQIDEERKLKCEAETTKNLALAVNKTTIEKHEEAKNELFKAEQERSMREKQKFEEEIQNLKKKCGKIENKALTANEDVRIAKKDARIAKKDALNAKEDALNAKENAKTIEKEYKIKLQTAYDKILELEEKLEMAELLEQQTQSLHAYITPPQQSTARAGNGSVPTGNGSAQIPIRFQSPPASPQPQNYPPKKVTRKRPATSNDENVSDNASKRVYSGPSNYGNTPIGNGSIPTRNEVQNKTEKAVITIEDENNAGDNVIKLEDSDDEEITIIRHLKAS